MAERVDQAGGVGFFDDATQVVVTRFVDGRDQWVARAGAVGVGERHFRLAAAEVVVEGGVAA